MGFARAPGKLMLLGEHSVVYGRKCIVTSTDSFCDALAEKHEDYYFNLPDVGFQGTVNDLALAPKEASFVAAAVNNFSKKYGIPTKVKITTKTRYAKKYGLGSSSAASVATVRALDRLFETRISNPELFKVAYSAVLDVQKAGSGFDVAVGVYGGTLLYQNRNQVQEASQIDIKKLDLIVAYTGVSTSTVNIVKEVAESRKSNHQFYENLFDQIEELVKNAQATLEKGDMKKLGELFNHNQEILRSFKAPGKLGVSSEKIEELITAARNAGAYGGKLSGSGIGDCIIVATPEESRDDVLQALTERGGEIVACNLNIHV